MRKVYEDQSMMMVEYYRTLLLEEGIATSVRNEFAHLAAGEIPFTQVYPELWVNDESHYDRAVALIAEVRDLPTEEGLDDSPVNYQRPLVMRVFMAAGSVIVVGLLLWALSSWILDYLDAI